MVQFLSIKAIQDRLRIGERIRVNDIVLVDDVHKAEDHYTDFEHQFDGLIISFCLAGNMSLKLNFHTHEIDAGSIVVVLPQLIIDPVRVSDDFRVVSLVMSLDFISAFPVLRDFITNDEIRRRPVVPAEARSHDLFDKLLLALRKCYEDETIKGDRKKKILQYLVFALITAISNTYDSLSSLPATEGNRKNEIIDTFYQLVAQHAHKQRSVSFYAAQLNLSQQYLSGLVKEQTGKPVMMWVEQVLIMHAKSLLKSTSLSIKEISQELNFADVSLFCRYFKRCTQVTPKAFRNRQE